jgi:hypothetical protein
MRAPAWSDWVTARPRLVGGVVYTWLTLWVSVGGTACLGGSIPDPKEAATAYAGAAARGDADAIYAMMTSSAQKERSREDIKRIVADERVELSEQAQALSAKDARVEATARLRFDDGEETALELREGRFWVTNAGTLPGGARTPEEALDQLRRVLARRSYAGLMRVLSPATRAAMERDLRALVTGLEHPDGLQVQIAADQAKVTIAGGHHVSLKREGGIWRIEDFD